MPTLAPPCDLAAVAARHWRANRAALARHQPIVADLLDGCDPAGDWMTARDGTLTTRADGQWFAGCSVPRLAGRALLCTLVAAPGGHALLAPAHAGLLSAARERLGPAAVLFVLQPDAVACRTILGCDDMAADIAVGRLWFATGDRWADHLATAFADHRGLATPAQFVRTRLTADADVDPLVTDAQRVFGDVATARATAIACVTPRPGTTPLVVCRSAFTLWDVSAVLADAVGGDRYDLDDPLTASPLALAEAAAGASAVAAADLGRGDAAAVVSTGTPWVTWMTQPAPPTFATAGPADRVVVADPAWTAHATVAGWPAERVSVGRCPPLVPPSPLPPRPTVALLTDTGPITPPASVKLYSTHLLLWEAIAAELHADPLTATDPAAFLADRARRMGIDVLLLDQLAFFDGLIGPGYVQGVGRLLIDGGLPVRLWGTGWDELPEFADAAAGPITDADTFAAAVSTATVLVRPTPGCRWHPVDACGRAVLTPTAGFDLCRTAVALMANQPLVAVTTDPLPAAIRRALEPV